MAFDKETIKEVVYEMFLVITVTFVIVFFLVLGMMFLPKVTILTLLFLMITIPIWSRLIDQ